MFRTTFFALACVVATTEALKLAEPHRAVDNFAEVGENNLERQARIAMEGRANKGYQNRKQRRQNRKAAAAAASAKKKSEDEAAAAVAAEAVRRSNLRTASTSELAM